MAGLGWTRRSYACGFAASPISPSLPQTTASLPYRPFTMGETVHHRTRKDLFLGEFSRKCDQVHDLISQICSSSLSKEEVENRLQAGELLLTQACQQIAESHGLLPAYDLKKCQGDMSDISKALERTRSMFAPKKKFAFSKTKSLPTESSRNDLPTAAPLSSCLAEEGPAGTSFTPPGVVAEELPTASTASTASVVARFSGKNQTTILLQDDYLDQSVEMQDLDHCSVNISVPVSTLRLQNLSGCTVTALSVSYSVFVVDCKDLTFRGSVQQLRIHSSSQCKFFVCVTGGPILEDCTGLGFAPLSPTLPPAGPRSSTDHPDSCINRWDQVVDFNWLTQSVPSPNWYIMTGEEEPPHRPETSSPIPVPLVLSS